MEQKLKSTLQAGGGAWVPAGRGTAHTRFRDFKFPVTDNGPLFKAQKL